MSRSVAIDLAAEYFDSGAFLADLTRRVAFPTETGASGHHADLLAYLEQEMVGLPTVWVPHSYPACAQHAPDEHLLAPLARQALRLMAGLFWDLGEYPVS